MSETLYLIESRARTRYICPACGKIIAAGEIHYRHTPHPAAWIHRGKRGSHWCRQCISASTTNPIDSITRRLRVPAVRVLESSASHSVEPIRVELIGIGKLLSQKLLVEPSLVHALTPGQFEELICDRLFAMGLEPRRVGRTNQKDGGIDLLFWSREKGSFPFLGAAQVKHHRELKHKEGPSTVREFQGVIGAQPISAGLIVTNTAFTSDAKWFAREHAKLVRLRDFVDIKRWLLNEFGDEEWRDLPSSIELCPGVIVKVR